MEDKGELTYANIDEFRERLVKLLTGKEFTYKGETGTHKRQRLEEPIGAVIVGGVVRSIPIKIPAEDVFIETTVARTGETPGTGNEMIEQIRTVFDFARDGRSVKITTRYAEDGQTLFDEEFIIT